MPRVAKPTELAPTFPWEEWGTELSKSPTGALIFGPDDFGDMAPYNFKRKAQKAFAYLGAKASVRGDEVLVIISA